MRPHIKNITNQTLVTQSSIYETFNVESTTCFAVQVTYTPALNLDANFHIQGSIDGVNFATLECASSKLSPTPQSKIFNVSDIAYPFMRVYVEIITGHFEQLRIDFARR